LGHRFRPGAPPSDDEVRELLCALRRDAHRHPESRDDATGGEDEEESPRGVAAMADQLDRFAIYRMRLVPLESVKQNPKDHPEGDALYHSLQAFQLARERRPYDEGFLLAALLHDVGKALGPFDLPAGGVGA